MTVIFCKGTAGRSDWCKKWVSEAHDRCRISVEEVDMMLNHEFPRDSFSLALAACINLLTNALMKEKDVVIDQDSTNSKSRTRMEGVCRRAGADIRWKEF